MAIHYTIPYYTIDMLDQKCLAVVIRCRRNEDTERALSRSELRRRAMALLQRAGEPVHQGSFVGP